MTQTTPGNVTTLMIDDLVPHTEYTYRVRAISDFDSVTDWSDPLKYWFLPPPTVGTPVINWNSIALNWVRPSGSNWTIIEMWDEDEDRWEPEYAGDGTAHTVGNLQPLTLYQFRLKCIQHELDPGYDGEWVEHQWTTTDTPD
jgi:hypothetical protein